MPDRRLCDTDVAPLSTLSGPEIRYRAIGYEYPDADTAKEAFDRATAKLKNCSLWRTATPDLSRWFVIGLLSTGCDDQNFEWGGKPFKLAADQIEWMTSRRIARGIKAVITQEGEVHEKNQFEPEEAPHVGKW